MGNPYLEGLVPAQRSPAQGPAAQANPYLDGLVSVPPSTTPKFSETSRIELSRQFAGANQQAIDNLRALMELPNVGDDQKRRIARLIDVFGRDDKIANRMRDDPIFKANFLRGVSKGFVNFGILGTADMAAALIDLVPGVDLTKPGGLRRDIQEAQQITGEYFDPRGVTGVAGEVVGGLAGAFAPYGVAGGLTGRAVLALGSRGGRLGTAYKALQTGTATYRQRIITNMVGGVGLDALRAVTLPDATKEQKLTQFAIDTGFSAAGAVFFEHASVQAFFHRTAATIKRPRVAAAGEGKPGDLTAPTAETSAARAYEHATAEYQSRLKRRSRLGTIRARNSWKNGNVSVRRALGATDEQLTKTWDELDDEFKNGLIAQFEAELPKPDAPKRPETPRGADRRTRETAMPEERRIKDRRLAKAVDEAKSELDKMDETIAETKKVVAEATEFTNRQAELDAQEKARRDAGTSQPRTEVDPTVEGNRRAQEDIDAARTKGIAALNDDELVAWYRQNAEWAGQDPNDFRARSEADEALKEIRRRNIDLGAAPPSSIKAGPRPEGIQTGIPARPTTGPGAIKASELLKDLIDDPSTSNALRRLLTEDRVWSRTDVDSFRQRLDESIREGDRILEKAARTGEMEPGSTPLMADLGWGARDPVDILNELDTMKRILDDWERGGGAQGARPPTTEPPSPTAVARPSGTAPETPPGATPRAEGAPPPRTEGEAGLPPVDDTPAAHARGLTDEQLTRIYDTYREISTRSSTAATNPEFIRNYMALSNEMNRRGIPLDLDERPKFTPREIDTSELIGGKTPWNDELVTIVRAIRSYDEIETISDWFAEVNLALITALDANVDPKIAMTAVLDDFFHQAAELGGDVPIDQIIARLRTAAQIISASGDEYRPVTQAGATAVLKFLDDVFPVEPKNYPFKVTPYEAPPKAKAVLNTNEDPLRAQMRAMGIPDPVQPSALSRDQLAGLRERLAAAGQDTKLVDGLLEQATHELQVDGPNAADRLRLAKLKKPLDQHTNEELEDLFDLVDRAYDKALKAGKDLGEDYTHDLDLIGNAKRKVKTREAMLKKKAELEGAQVPDTEAPIDPAGPKVDLKATAEKSSRVPPDEYRRMFNQPVGELSDHQLRQMHYELVDRTSNMRRGDVDKNARLMFGKMDAIIEELRRRGLYGGQGGFTVQSSPVVGASILGFFAGFATEDGTVEEKLHAGMMGAIGFGLTTAYLRRRMGPKGAFTQDLPWYRKKAKEKIISIEDQPAEQTKGFLTRLQMLYTQVARRSFPVERFTKALGGAKLAFSQNPGKMAEVFGRWRKRTDSWIFGRPSFIDEQGERVFYDAIGLHELSAMVNGDTGAFGEFLIAARDIDLMRRGKRPVLDPLVGREIFSNAPEEFHTAQVEALKYARALADEGVRTGMISPELRASFEEDIYYIPLNRLFGEQARSPGPTATVKTTGGPSGDVGTKQQFHPLKTSSRHVRNGFEALIENTPRILRSAEFNDLAKSMANLTIAAREGGQKDLADMLMTPISAAQVKTSSKIQGEIRAVMDEMKSLGKTISRSEAEKIVYSMSDEALNMTDDVLRFWRDGVLEHWRINEDLALSLRALSPPELDLVIRLLGAPAQLARVGITAGPRFVFWQAFRDNFQFFLNAQYGFVPFVDQARGWWNIVSRSKDYADFVAGGGSGDSLADEGLRVVRHGFGGRKRDILSQVRSPVPSNELENVARQVKDMRFREAYASIIAPIADAARVGAYLRARGRGISVVEAVYTSKRAGANFSQRGASNFVRGLNHMTLFLNASIQSLDETARSFARNPVSYTIKAVAGITLPSIYLWFAYKDDKEIQQLRGTETGRRYWFFRDGDNNIRRLPKPIFDGQIWGGAAEAALDKMLQDDPDAMAVWGQALSQDAMIHLLPTIGVVPASIIANHDLVFGGQVVPEADERFDPELWYHTRTSFPARVVGKAVSSASKALSTNFELLARALSPAGIDYIVRNFTGEVFHEVIRAVGDAYRYTTEPGFSVAAEEAAILGPFAAVHYPKRNVAAISEFYSHAKEAERTANTMLHIANAEPDRLEGYLNQHMSDVALWDLYKEARADLADLRAAILDVDEASTDFITSQEKRDLRDEFLRAMIDVAIATNESAREIAKATTTK